MNFNVETLESADLNGALTAVAEREGGRTIQIRVRPHQPSVYYPAQKHSVVLRWDELDALFALAERNGYKRTIL